MSIHDFDDSQAAPSLAGRINGRADAAQIADEIVTRCRKINDVLAPIIGRLGVDALYERSLHLAMPIYPWLAMARDGAQEFMNLATLKSTLAAQSSAGAAAGGGALLQTFQDLLASLVGASLTERLLHPVWNSSPDSPLAQGHSDTVRPYSIDDDGIHLGETLPDMEGLLLGRPMRKRSGLSLSLSVSLPMLSTETVPRALPGGVSGPALASPTPEPTQPATPDGT